MTAPIKLDRTLKKGLSQGGLGIEILYPGLAFGKGDSGVGAIGRIDHARFKPGGRVPMHPHKDDEILTYLRGGTVIHRDTVGKEQQLSGSRLMLMNAGHTFQHEEESLPGNSIIEALQIFVRPREANLEAQVQFHDFGKITSDGQWRLVAGPTDAPLIFRANAWVHDIRLTAGEATALPPTEVQEVARLIYVFTGSATVDGTVLEAGESLLIHAAGADIHANTLSDLVVFTTDLAEPVFKGGMFSGNMLAR